MENKKKQEVAAHIIFVRSPIVQMITGIFSYRGILDWLSKVHLDSKCLGWLYFIHYDFLTFNGHGLISTIPLPDLSKIHFTRLMLESGGLDFQFKPNIHAIRHLRWHQQLMLLLIWLATLFSLYGCRRWIFKINIKKNIFMWTLAKLVYNQIKTFPTIWFSISL